MLTSLSIIVIPIVTVIVRVAIIAVIVARIIKTTTIALYIE